MTDINDFGFTAVDQEELVTKTGDKAGIGEEVAEQLKAVAASSAGQANSAQIEALDSKVDLLQKLISNALGELDDHKDNLVAIDTKKELDYKEILQAMVLQMSQQAQNQNNQIKVNDNQRVIKPGSLGLWARDPSKEVMIVRIFYRPSGLAYEAKFKLNINASDEMSWSKVSLIEIDDVLEIPGETITGIYNYNTGTVD